MAARARGVSADPLTIYGFRVLFTSSFSLSYCSLYVRLVHRASPRRLHAGCRLSRPTSRVYPTPPHAYRRHARIIETQHTPK
eukprot:3344308-Prymnesium_polylepis.4